MKYQHKPNIVQAMRYTGSNLPEVEHFVGDKYYANRIGVFLKTKSGPALVAAGDWIVKRDKNDFCPVKPDVFETHYEAVGEP